MIAKIEDCRRWPITPEHRQIVIDELMAIVRGKNRAQAIRAARLLLELSEFNHKIDESEVGRMRHEIIQVLRQRQEATEN